MSYSALSTRHLIGQWFHNDTEQKCILFLLNLNLYGCSVIQLYNLIMTACSVHDLIQRYEVQHVHLDWEVVWDQAYLANLHKSSLCQQC